MTREELEQLKPGSLIRNRGGAHFIVTAAGPMLIYTKKEMTPHWIWPHIASRVVPIPRPHNLIRIA